MSNELDAWPFPRGSATSFERAPMPAASLAWSDGQRLHAVDAAYDYALTPELAQAVVRARPGVTLGATEAGGKRLRLRRCARGPAPLWRIEPVESGQRRLLALLHPAVASILGRTVVHELQNPLYAACLRVELLRASQERDAAQRASVLEQLDSLRDRLSQLANLQGALAQRWLCIDGAGASQALPMLLAEVGDLLRAFYARRGLGLVMDIHIAGELLLPAATASMLHTALSAILLMLAPPQRSDSVDSEEPQVRAYLLDGAGEEQGAAACIELPSPAAARDLDGLYGWTFEELLAAFGLMLQRHGIVLDAARTTRLIVPLDSLAEVSVIEAADAGRREIWW